MLGVDGLGGSRQVLSARITTAPTERRAVRREAQLRIENRFDKEGIGLAE
jgi:small-conductance mechanosensitive channel